MRFKKPSAHAVWLVEGRRTRREDTFASRLIANGENLKYISEQLGHASIAITVDTYGHLIPGGNRAAVDRLDNIVTASS